MISEYPLLTKSRADLNTANDLWQYPRFPAFELPFDTLAPETRFFYQEPTQSEVIQEPNVLQSLIIPPPIPNFDTVLEELRTFVNELAVVTRSFGPLNPPRIQMSDKILYIERRLIGLIHDPTAYQNLLDNSCAVAALIFLRANLRDSICTFGIDNTSKLKIALQSVLELPISWRSSMDVRSREKLIWAVGYGAVSSGSTSERPWFVRLFRELCQTLELQSWEFVKGIFKSVLWQDELDGEGLRLWDEVRTI